MKLCSARRVGHGLARRACIVGMLLIVPWLAGCSRENSTSDPAANDLQEAHDIAVRNHWKEEAAWLSTGKVTASNVEEAWRRYSQCIRRGGGDVGPARFYPLDSVSYGGQTLPNGLTREALQALVERCTPRLNIITGSYAMTHERRIDPGIIPEIRECLQAQGFDVSSEKQIENLVNPPVTDSTQLADLDQRAMACVAPYLQ